ncbi:unnamed protein product [Effrenium voratum]|uniref:Putative gamma-glutamylcyclotransferase n=1 Tax=Effrenium voratum TaxID=2562239 RepID=A0AA36MK40_9DINO|nr:unnamed protein product [Effrenium voratum]
MDPLLLAASRLASHAGVNEADAGVVGKALVGHVEEVTGKPLVWGAELEDPWLGPRIAEAAEEAMKSIKADWGPVFVYGPLLLPAVWGELIGRVPEMAPAKIWGFVRRGLICSPEAALVVDEGLAVGQVVYGLLPWERKLVDVVMEDTFAMSRGSVRLIEDELQQDVEVTMYLWREEFLDGVTDEDWSIETFEKEWLQEYMSFCRDMRKQKDLDALGDEELKEMTMTGRRSQKDEEGDFPEDGMGSQFSSSPQQHGL